MSPSVEHLGQASFSKGDQRITGGIKYISGVLLVQLIFFLEVTGSYHQICGKSGVTGHTTRFHSVDVREMVSNV